MYVILKPETRKHIGSIETTLAEEGFKITSRHAIENWTGLAKELYANQAKSNPQFHAELECYLWLTQHIFGNHATAFLLERKGNLAKNLKDLHKFKNKLRYKVSNGSDELLRIFLDVDKINSNGRYVLDSKIKIEIPGENSNRRWDHYFFKYVHTPDNSGAYEREISVLKNNFILNQSLSYEQWQQMKYMQTLIPPNGFWRPKNE